jgi:group I intron endonuclease
MINMTENKDKEYHYTVYMYTFPNGKKYVGKTRQSLKKRQGPSFKKYESSALLWDAIQEYGCESIQQDVLVEGDLTEEMSSELEEHFIEKYKTNANKYNDPSYGYNLTSGGLGMKDWTPTPERYEQLCEQLKINRQNAVGSTRSEESIEKMRQAKLGKKRGPMSEECKQKIAKANSRENMSEETRKRRSESKKKKIAVTDNKNGNVEIYDSLSDIADRFSVGIPTVTRWCKKERTPSNNYTFDYYEPPATTEREDLELYEDATV